MHKSLKKLIEGNQRFAQNKSIHPNLSQELRSSLLSKQNPFAAIVACADSRVPVEIIFDAGIGDLFVIRSAGHVLSKEALGSLEYAVKELGVKFIMILGHDKCGAVTSALESYKNHENLSDNVKTLLSHIYPVFDHLNNSCENILDESIKSNIKYQVEYSLKNSPFLSKKVQDEKLLIVGAKYSLEKGIIDVFE